MPSQEVYRHRVTVLAVGRPGGDPWGSSHLFIDRWIPSPRSNQYFYFIPIPDGYRHPKIGDYIELEVRLEKRPRKKRRSWNAVIVAWPADYLERCELQDVEAYDS